MLYKGFTILLFAALLAGCASHRTASIGWDANQVRIQMTPPGGSSLFTKPALTCLSCNEATPTVATTFDDNGVLKFTLGEANENITHRFRLDASGIDTSLILKTPPPDVAMKRYGLSQPLIGRVLVTEFAMIYRDTTMSQTVGKLERQDEANIFSENETFFFIHHPRYKEPVVILKNSAIRMY